MWLTSIGLSQFISNVPATILLLNYVPPSTLLAWAVNVGGFGLLPGSLANLIALRMAGDRRIWWRFPRLFPAHAAVGGAGGVWIAAVLIFRELGKKRTETPHSRSPFSGV